MADFVTDNTCLLFLAVIVLYVLYRVFRPLKRFIKEEREEALDEEYDSTFLAETPGPHHK